MPGESPAPHVDRLVSTGIPGLDEILCGGLPAECFYLVQGDPGSGKTTLAMQFLLEGRRRGEHLYYITLSETEAELQRVARSHDWSLEGIRMLELSAIENMMRPEGQTSIFHAAELQLSNLTRLVLEEVRKHKPQRVVFDSLSEFRLMAETPLRYRRQLLSLKQEFARHGCTVLMLDDKMDTPNGGPDTHVLSLAHGVLEMEQLSPEYGRSRRRLRALKLRGVGFREGYHDYVIATGGLEVYPRLVAAEHHTDFTPGPVSSGIPELDAVLGGGLDRGTTTLILGQAGTGKSTLALQYATQLASMGEKSSLFAFDETRATVLTRATKLGLDFADYEQRGIIALQQIDPAETSPGEFAHRILTAVHQGCRMVVIDTLNGYLNAMPGEKYLNSQLHELSAYLNQQGVVTVFVLAQHGLVQGTETPVDLSYLADTVVSLRFFEVAGSVRKALAVIKKRSGAHESTIREYKLQSGRGISVGRPLREFQGVLGGLPVFHGSAQHMLPSTDGVD
ncbi:MAG: AAA family ATPase [Gammaproteobacteria bacterium]|nr:AAA family ATPase [Gammaproteobacteria bacterium]